MSQVLKIKWINGELRVSEGVNIHADLSAVSNVTLELYQGDDELVFSSRDTQSLRFTKEFVLIGKDIGDRAKLNEARAEARKKIKAELWDKLEQMLSDKVVL